jgi:hypothetical protein
MATPDLSASRAKPSHTGSMRRPVCREAANRHAARRALAAGAAGASRRLIKISSRKRQSRSSAGLLRDFLMLHCAFLCSTIATAVQPQSFRSIQCQQNQTVAISAFCRISQPPRRIALTRRRSAVRSRQHPPVSRLFALSFILQRVLRRPQGSLRANKTPAQGRGLSC